MCGWMSKNGTFQSGCEVQCAMHILGIILDSAIQRCSSRMVSWKWLTQSWNGEIPSHFNVKKISQPISYIFERRIFGQVTWLLGFVWLKKHLFSLADQGAVCWFYHVEASFGLDCLGGFSARVQRKQIYHGCCSITLPEKGFMGFMGCAQAE